MPRRLLTLFVAAASIAGLSACHENLETGAGCPVLCSQVPIDLRDTLIDAVVVDSTLTGFPAIGFEETLLLANHGDSLETRVFVRFDSLGTEYFTPGGVSEPVVFVDSVRLRMRLIHPLRDPATPFTIRAYDVDTVLPAESGADTTVRALTPLFREDRLLGSITVVPSALTDSTITLPIASERLLDKITGEPPRRLRIGLTIEGAQSVSVRLAGQGDLSTLSLRYRVSEDTTIAPVQLLPRSSTPDERFTAAALADYQLTFRGPPPLPANVLAVGGAPGRRTYLRFELPSRIVDSTRVVRAALILTQAPNRSGAARTDTVTVLPDVIVADTNVTNLERAVRFTSRTFTIGGSVQSVPPVRLVPADSGERSVEMAALIAAWGSLPRSGVPRALVLRAEDEGAIAGTILFFSREAPAAVRPRLRLTYAPRLEFGLP